MLNPKETYKRSYYGLPHFFICNNKMHKPVASLILLILFMIAIFQFFPANATNPITRPHASAPEGVDINFNIQHPIEDTPYFDGKITAIFNVTINGPASINGQPLNKHLGFTYYQGDWMLEKEFCSPTILTEDFHSYNFSVSSIPSGQHTIEFTGNAQGDFVLANGSSVAFSMEKSVSVNLLINEYIAIEFLLPQNYNSTSSSFPLNFTVDRPVTEITYTLDNQEPTSISGNTTLINLSNGRHTVTIYARNEFGHTGTSDTLIFNIDASEPFPVGLFVVAVAVIIVCAGIVVYLKKHKRNT